MATSPEDLSSNVTPSIFSGGANGSASHSFSAAPKLSIKLDDKNYLLWNQQVEGVITTHKLHRLLVNPEIPQQFLSEADRTANKTSEAYEKWIVQDQMLFTWLLSTLSKSVLPRVLSCRHASQVWDKIHTHYFAHLRAKVRQLRSELKNSKKGLSLKSQELTAMFLAVRLYCSFVMEYDIHTILDLATFVTTVWVIYMIRFKLKASYMEEKDNFAIYYVVIPCAVLALLIHPSTSHHIVNRIFWAFCVYLEAVSVLPQLRVMQNTKIVEPFTAHYVFALGVARFLSCAHWVLQVLDSRGHLLVALGYGLWPSMVLISEIVQTFILADFCYYYVKSVFGGQLVLRLPSGVV